MTEHTVRAFGEKLEQLGADLQRMGGLAESQTADAFNAIVRRDTQLAQVVIDRDGKLDAAQREIDKRATLLLALRQPMAIDLREVLSAMKIAADLERIGDLARNIAKRTLVLNQSEPVQLTRSIDRMGRIANARLKDVLDSYAKRSIASAVHVWEQDDEIDAHYTSLFRELLTYMMEDPRTISSCAHLLFVAKNIERIGDHCTNIAETVHYLITGEEIARERPKADDIVRGVDD
jgi:phosphate transport system protein